MSGHNEHTETAKHGWKIKMRHIKIVASETKSVNKKREKKMPLMPRKVLLSEASAQMLRTSNDEFVCM